MIKYFAFVLFIFHTLLTNAQTVSILPVAVSDTFLIPYGLEFLNESKLLVSDRPKGKLYILDINTKKRKEIKGLPKITGQSFGGLMDIKLHPQFEKNNLVYFNYTIKENGNYYMRLNRAILKRNKLIKNEILFSALPGYKDEGHFGSSIALKDGYIYFAMGDFYDLKDSAQSLSNHLGKILRLHDDGQIPKDNPFVNTPNAKPEIWTYGHRNPQGLMFHPASGQLIEHEHGPRGGDEINIIRPGLNYGWPVICHGIDYYGKPIGAGIKEHEGMEQPLHFYLPSIAPCGIEIYTANRYPEWKNSLFIGGLGIRHLNRIEFQNDNKVHEERLFTDRRWRVRSVRQGKDGYLYIGVDNGPIYRLQR